MVWNSWVLTLDHFLEQALHVISSEGRYQTTHLVKHASQAPNITFAIIGHVFPNLRTRIVWRSCLGVAKTFLCYFTDVQVSQLCLHILEQKDICTFHVPMEDLANVKRPQAPHDLNKDVPNFFLLDVSLSFLVTANFLKDIATVCVLHYQTQA